MKSLQTGCFVGFNHGDQEGADIRLGEMGRLRDIDVLTLRKVGQYIRGELKQR